MRLWIVATSSGLSERSEAYQAHLDLSIASQSNVTLSVPIFLSVSASTTAAVWGAVPENGRCTEATTRMANNYGELAGIARRRQAMLHWEHLHVAGHKAKVDLVV